MLLQDGLGPSVSVFLSDVETDAWPEGTVQAVAAASARLVVTKGEHGADELSPGGTVSRIPTTPVAAVADTNGAGDTFATAYMVALMRGYADPGAVASWAASRAVMQPQVGGRAGRRAPAVAVWHPHALQAQLRLSAPDDAMGTHFRSGQCCLIQAPWSGGGAPPEDLLRRRSLPLPQACKPRCAPALLAAADSRLPALHWPERLAMAVRALVREQVAAVHPLLRLPWLQEVYSTVRARMAQ
jgi:hypothetical protein